MAGRSFQIYGIKHEGLYHSPLPPSLTHPAALTPSSFVLRPNDVTPSHLKKQRERPSSTVLPEDCHLWKCILEEEEELTYDVIMMRNYLIIMRQCHIKLYHNEDLLFHNDEHFLKIMTEYLSREIVSHNYAS